MTRSPRSTSPSPFRAQQSTTPRDRDFHVQHVKLDITVNPEEKNLEGTVHLTLTPIIDNVTRLEFDAVDLDIADVKLSLGKISSSENTGRKFIVYLDKALKMSENLTVSIRYSGEPRRGLYFIGPDKYYPPGLTRHGHKARTRTAVTGSPATTIPTTEQQVR